MEYNKICHQEPDSKKLHFNNIQSLPIPIPYPKNKTHVQYKNYQINNDNDIDTDSNIDSNITDINNNNCNSEQYSLHLNNFNPSKMSPPNLWKIRLQSRIETHYNKSLFS